MTSAEFVRNPDVNTSVYRWEAVGVDELTRKNKLTSLPFWIPNNTTRRHQFRFVLLRGLVPSADPANDAFGLLVELIPPPSPPTAAAAASGERLDRSATSSSDYPGGCAVTCVVVPLDALDGSKPSSGAPGDGAGTRRATAADKALSATKTAVVDESNAQISFPDFISADILTNARYVSGTPKSFTIQVTIETGISVPLHQVATTAYSFFSSLTSSVTQLLGTTTQLVHEGRENLNAILTQAAASGQPAYEATTKTAGGKTGGVDHTGKSANNAAAAAAEDALAALPPAPWDQPPEEWRGRPEAWRQLLCARLASFDGTYRHGVEKVLTSDELALLTEVGLSEADLWARYALFDFNRDVQENLLSATTIRARRYALVPAKLKEETFWANYFWKVHCVGQCVTARQVCAVIATLCTPPRTADPNMAAPVEEVLRVVLDAADVASVLRDFTGRGEAGEAWCTVVAETARHCVAVLQVASQRTDLSSNTSAQLTKALAALTDELSKYGDALLTPPSSPAAEAAAAPPSHIATSDAVHDPVGAAVAATTVVEKEEENSVNSKEETQETGEEAVETPVGFAEAAHTATKTITEEVQSAADVLPVSPPHDASTPPLAQTQPSPPSAAREPTPPPSPTAASPAATTAAVPRSEGGGRSTSRLEFAKMPWEEEDD